MARIKQFILDVIAPLRRMDQSIPDRYLGPREKEQLSLLRRAEILHVIAVARSMESLLRQIPQGMELLQSERELIVKASLLHDLGKIHYAAGPIRKTLAVLLDKTLEGKTDASAVALTRWKTVDIYRNHPEYGYRIVSDLNSFPGFPYLEDLIRYHHKPWFYHEKYQAEHSKERIVFELFAQADEAN